MKTILSPVAPIAAILFIMTSTYSQQESSRDWTSFVQTVDVASNNPVKFKVTAFAKTMRTDTLAGSGLWARVDTKNGERGFFDNMGDRAIIANEWQSYTIEGSLDENSKALNFGALCWGNGKFFFDKFEVSIQNAQGEFENFDISNPSFEKAVVNNKLQDWIEGIIDSNPVRIKEYTFHQVRIK